MGKKEKPDLPFSATFLQGADGCVFAHPRFSSEPVELEEFEEGTSLVDEVRLRGQGYDAELLEFLRSADVVTDGKLFRFLAELLEETRERAIKGVLTNCRESVPPKGGN